MDKPSNRAALGSVEEPKLRWRAVGDRAVEPEVAPAAPQEAAVAPRAEDLAHLFPAESPHPGSV